MERKGEYCLEWTIENFSCWNSEIHGKCLDYPQYSMRLYPRGIDGDGDHLEVQIFDNYESSFLELSFIGGDGSLICKLEVQDPEWDGGGITLPPGPNFEDVVRAGKNKDILVLKLYLSGEDETFDHKRTIIDIVDKCIKIPTHIFSDGQYNKKIDLFTFHYIIGDNKYEIEFNALLKNSSSENLKISFLLYPSIDGSTNEHLFIRTFIYLFDSSDIVVKSEENDHTFRDEYDWNFFSISEAKEIVENGFYLILHLKFTSGRTLYTENHPSIEDIESSTTNTPYLLSQKANNFTENFSASINSPVSVLSEELMCLYQDQDFSDFQLKCDNVTFPVHKAILGARSPVFKTMLSTDMKESASSEVDIKDLDPSTLTRFLAFLYTGNVDEMQCDSALKLYYAADKYQVPTLKRECVSLLCAEVSISNVCDILSLADKHQDDELTGVARDFILRHYNEVLASDEWGFFMKSEPLLAVETVTHFAKKNVVGEIKTS